LLGFVIQMICFRAIESVLFSQNDAHT